MRDREVVSHQAHNLETVGSSPTPATIDWFKKGLGKTCQVLIALHDQGPMTSREIALKTGLNHDHISSICAYLCLKKKAKRQNPLSKTGYIWEAIPEPEPVPRKKYAKSRSVSTCIKEDVKRGVRQTFLATRFREEKIQFLNRLIKLPYFGFEDKDLIVGMIADYKVRR